LAILLREVDVEKLVNFKDIYDSLERAFKYLSNKNASNTKRIRTIFHGSVMTYQAGAFDNYLGFKVFVKGTYLGVLYSLDGDIVLVVEADLLSRIRTGILSVLVSDYLAKKNYTSVGIIGLGKQGEFQVKSFNELKKGVTIRAISKEKTDKNIKRLQSQGLNVIPAKDYKELCSTSEVIVTITSSKDPFLKLEFLNHGTHINALGSNLPERAELFPEVIKASSLIAVEDLEQAKEEAGDLILAEKMKMLDWNKVVLISDVINGKVGRKSDDEITIFKSTGIGLEDVATMKLLYEKAKKYGLGVEIDLRGKWSQELERK